MRRAEIEEQNRSMLKRQHEFRMAADVVTEAWTAFAEVQAVAVIGSVAKALWKEVPRFREFRREGIEVWHECRDLDLALWVDSQERLNELRRATSRALRAAYEAGTGVSIVDHQGKLLSRFGDPHAGTAPTAFLGPHGLTVDSRGDLYVGEVSWTQWPQFFDTPRPAHIRSLQKYEKVH